MALLDVKPYDKWYYETVLKPFLPQKFIDCHAHVWLNAFHNEGSMREGSQLWPRMVASENSVEDLNETNRLLFPDNQVISTLYSDAIVTIDREKSNEYVAQKAKENGFPALYLSHPGQSVEELERKVLAHPEFKGLKVYLQFAPAYIPADEIRIYDFLPHEHLALANKHKWVVQLHIARPKRLADPVNYYQLLEIEQQYPDLQLLVAHLGRAYANEDLGDALDFLKHTEKMVWDFTANTNDYVMEKVLEYFGSERFIYGTDFPIFRMKARRTVENGFYINEVPEGEFPKSAIASDSHMREIPFPEAEKITFFIYEQINACRMACERLGLGKQDVEKIFWSNSARIFDVK
ncbi:MAG: amidohydrolase family protein [Oscillospiraceae bacterium]|nr:amidohydrolase family protein [Oscillospiraceae bacterium]